MTERELLFRGKLKKTAGHTWIDFAGRECDLDSDIATYFMLYDPRIGAFRAFGFGADEIAEGILRDDADEATIIVKIKIVRKSKVLKNED